MLKEALKYLVEKNINPNDRLVGFKDTKGDARKFFIDDQGVAREIKPVDRNAKSPLYLNTLTGFVNYIKSDMDTRASMFVHVKSEKEVMLEGLLDDEGHRECLAVSNAIIPEFNFDRFHDMEELIIAFQAMFTDTDDRDLLLKVVGNVKEENVRNTGDSGVSQQVTIQSGVASADNVKVPNPVELAPYRTFLEVEQPASEFVFRMKDGPTGAIFEADGGAWRHKAIENVRKYLEEELKEEITKKKIIILS